MIFNNFFLFCKKILDFIIPVLFLFYFNKDSYSFMINLEANKVNIAKSPINKLV